MASRRSPDSVNPARRAARPRKAPPVLMPPRATLTPEERHTLIAESAYLRAERRGFAPGHETDDWLEAEAEVDALLRAGLSSRQ